DRPVTFPPGRAKLETRPSPIGSLVIAKTIGISEVTCFAATAEVPALTITLVLRRTNSAVNCLARSGCPSDQRYSILAVLPSTQPSVRSRFTKASVHARQASASEPRKPMIGGFPDGCCPRAASGHATEQRDELASLHSITSSAVASSLSGTVRPSALAATTLMT